MKQLLGVTTAKIVDDLVAGRVTTAELGRFTPLGPRAPAAGPAAPPGIPTTLDQLTTQLSRTYDLSVTAATQLSIPVIGSVSGGSNRRVVVLERTAYKTVTDGATKYQYGYAIRLGITVNKLTGDIKVSLPFLAASSEIGTIEAKWILQVVGLSGAPIDKVAIPPTELNVETFVLAKQSLTALIEAVRDPATQFTGELLAVQRDADAVSREYVTAIGKAFALGRIGKGRKLGDAIKDLKSDRDELRDTVRDVYRDFAEITGEAEGPAGKVRDAANALLQGVKVEPR